MISLLMLLVPAASASEHLGSALGTRWPLRQQHKRGSSQQLWAPAAQVANPAAPAGLGTPECQPSRGEVVTGAAAAPALGQCQR